MLKSMFSLIISQVWEGLRFETIKKGFRKAGIYLFCDTILPNEIFEPAALRKFQVSLVENSSLPSVDDIVSDPGCSEGTAHNPDTSDTTTTVHACGDKNLNNAQEQAETSMGEDPAFLIMDGHLSCTKNLNVIEAARKHCHHPMSTPILYAQAPISRCINDVSLKCLLWLYYSGEISTIFGKAYPPTNAIMDLRNAEEAHMILRSAETADRLRKMKKIETPTAEVATKTETSATSPVPYGKDSTSTTSAASAGEPAIPRYNFLQPGPSGISTSCKRSFGYVSPSDIKPIPKMTGPKCTTKRKRGATKTIKTYVMFTPSNS
ncbi:hypothetical protein FQA39_LY02775 [Lamprigera yunnana]|nr:hypothetical protein FQA39_LY02775 [Lamprigera yunnana]